MPDAMRAVDRHYALLRLIYERVSAGSDHKTSDQERLRLALFVVMHAVELKHLCPALLVYRAIPRLAWMLPAPLQLEREA